MAVFRCKMCGGTIESAPGATVGICDSCGTRQTLPSDRDEALTGLHNRANTLRLKCEFDKAAELYDKILSMNHDDAEAHWGVILCKYGIEYVEDPKTYRRIPTCHRTSFDAIAADADYLAALSCGDYEQRSIYEAEAVEIDRIQKSILEIVRNEKPFDVFICYKETDENGDRTADSEMAEDIYRELTDEGFKVFYSAITLEDKLGEEYEPYIFAALTSARVMLAVATKPEYYSAVWVKNEWSRFLHLMKTDDEKILIPCYRDMDAYDLPDDFAHLQAQNMEEIGFIRDISRAVGRAVHKAGQITAASVTAPQGAFDSAISQLLQRAYILLDSDMWDEADKLCEKALDFDVGCGEAYLCKLLAELHLKSSRELAEYAESYTDSDNYKKIMRFGDEKLKAEIKEYSSGLEKRKEQARIKETYEKAVSMMNSAGTEEAFIDVGKLFRSIHGFRNADTLAVDCERKAGQMRKKRFYFEAARLEKNAKYDLSVLKRENEAAAAKSGSGKKAMPDYGVQAGKIISDLSKACDLYSSASGWEDADTKLRQCRQTLNELKNAEKERKKKEMTALPEEDKGLSQGAKTMMIISLAVFLLFVLIALAGGKNNYADSSLMKETGGCVETVIDFDGDKV